MTLPIRPGCIASLALLWCLPALSAATPALSISGPASVEQGQTSVAFDVDLDDAGGGIDLGGATIKVVFDDSRFSFSSATGGALLSGFDLFSSSASGDTVTLGIVPLFPITTSGTLAQVLFDVLDSATVGSTSLTFDQANSTVIDSAFSPLSPTYADLDSIAVEPASALLPGTPPLLLLGGLILLRARRSKLL